MSQSQSLRMHLCESGIWLPLLTRLAYYWDWKECLYLIRVEVILGLPRWLSGKEQMQATQEMWVQLLSGRSLRVGNSNTLQYSCLENSIDKGVWQVTVSGDEMVGWHPWLNGHEFEYTPGCGEGQGNLVCFSPWGHKESDSTEWLNNNSNHLLMLFSSLNLETVCGLPLCPMCHNVQHTVVRELN